MQNLIPWFKGLGSKYFIAKKQEEAMYNKVKESELCSFNVHNIPGIHLKCTGVHLVE